MHLVCRMRGRTLLDRFRVTEMVRRGGMGTVHRAIDLHDQSAAAVKCVSAEHAANPGVLARFASEIEALGALDVPGIPRLLGHGVDGGRPFLVMPWMTGRTIAESMDADGPPTVARTVTMIAGALERLESMHERGWLHGDVQPNNVLVDGDRVSLIDLGLARRLDRLPSATAEICGTPAYLAPEVACGRPPTAAADIYAVGVLLYELMAGALPFEGTTPVQILSRHVFDAPAPPSSREVVRMWSPRLEQVVARALAKQPAERYATASGMRAAVLEAVAGEAARTTAVLPRVEADAHDPLIEHIRAVARAVCSGDRAAMVAAYLRLGEHRLAAGDREGARRELEEAVQVTTMGEGLHADDAPPGFWRLLAALAALEERDGEHAESIHTLHEALRHAARDRDQHAIDVLELIRERLHHPLELPPLSVRHG